MLLIPRRKLLRAGLLALAAPAILHPALAQIGGMPPLAASPGGGGVTDTLNPSDKDAHVTLSNGNLTATGAAGISTFANVRSINGHSTGKWYFETTVVLKGGNNDGIGVANATAGLAVRIGGDTNGEAYYSGGNTFYNGTGTGTNGGSSTGQIEATAVDIDNNLFWSILYNIGGSRASGWNALSTGSTNDPGAGTGGFSHAFSGTLFAAISLFNVGSSCTVNLGAGAFVATVPTGFSAWG